MMFAYKKSSNHLIQLLLFSVLFFLQSAALFAAEIKWWEAAAKDSGHPKPVQYIQSLGLPQASADIIHKIVFNNLVVKADRGDTTAQYIVAIAYINGQGVSRNRAAGRRWLQRASDSGHARATALLEAGIPEYYNLGIPSAAGLSRSAAEPAAADIGNADVSDKTGQQSRQQSPVKTPAASGWQGLVDQATKIITSPYEGHYWSWWMGAAGLTFLALGFWMATGNTLGVSSSWDRVVSYRESRELEKANAALADASRNDIERAMMQATLDEFGDDIPDEMSKQLAELEASGKNDPMDSKESREQRAPYGAHVLFLLFMTIGGTVAALTTGDLEVRMDMGSVFVNFFGSGPLSWVILLVGGFFIGFGTRMGGGCTSGHALSGCSRLQPGSLVGTTVFFGTAIVVSIVMATVLG